MRVVFFFLILVGNLFADEGVMRHLYLTWQHDPCRTITVNVHGIHTPSELTLYYDTTPHHADIQRYAYRQPMQGKQPVRLPDRRLIYRVELTNLQPKTTYYFTVGDHKSSLGAENCFCTLDVKPPYLFIEGGDWENTPAALQLALQAAAKNPDGLLLGGDYPSAVTGSADYQKWDQWLDTYTHTMRGEGGRLIPFVMAIGNHEVVGGFGQPRSQVPFFFHYFCPGKSYFSLPLGDEVCLFVLDSGHTQSHHGEQLIWLHQELATYAAYPIKMALYHVPIFPSIRFTQKNLAYRSICKILDATHVKNGARRLFSYASRQGQEYWLPLFDAYQLTVAFEHHDQTLKRTKLLRAGREHPQGTLYLGDGGWGAEIQYPPIQGYFHNYFARLKGKSHFFWSVDIQRDAIHYQAISSEGEVIDHFTQPLTALTRNLLF